jgi:hypothetical protein
MVYEIFMDRRVPCSFSDLKSTKILLECATSITSCHHPAMMSVNKQVREEYTTIIMPRTMLHSNWLLNNFRRAVTPHDSKFPTLPTRIFSQLKILNLTVHRNATYLELGKLP